MKDEYEDVEDFIKDVLPIEYRKIVHKESEFEKPWSDSAAYKFEEMLEQILAETDKSNTDSEKK